MCDLGFLWRSLQADGAVALAHVYEDCTVAMGADGQRCARFVDYMNFVMQVRPGRVPDTLTVCRTH
jgi:hypothetical protein